MKALIKCSLGDVTIEVSAAEELHADLSIFHHKMKAFKTIAPLDLRMFILKPGPGAKNPGNDLSRKFVDLLIQSVVRNTTADKNRYDWEKARQHLIVLLSNPEVKSFLERIVAVRDTLSFVPLTFGFLFANPSAKEAVLLLDEAWQTKHTLVPPSKWPQINITVINALMAFLAFYLAENGEGLIAHGSGVSVANKGYLFMASSGGGKTAFSMAAPAGSVLADDGIIVRRRQDGYRLFPTPLRQRLGGESDTWVWHQAPVMLQTVFFLEKSLETRISPVSRFQVMGFLMNALTHFFMWMQPHQKISIFDYWRRLGAAVTFAELEWRLDSKHWPMINDFMKRGNKNETQKRNSGLACGI